MIRKAIIIMLTLAGVVTILLGLVSYATPIATTIYADKDGSRYLGLRAERGMLKVIHFHLANLTQAGSMLRNHNYGFLLLTQGSWPTVTGFEFENRTGRPLSYRTDTIRLGPPPPGGTLVETHAGIHCLALFAFLGVYPTITPSSVVRYVGIDGGGVACV